MSRNLAISPPGQHRCLSTANTTSTILVGISSPAASSTTATQLSPQPSSYNPPQQSTWNSATVVTVTLAAAALLVAILALLLKYRQEVNAVYQRTAVVKFGGYYQSICRLGTGFSSSIGKGLKGLIAMVGTGFESILKRE
ncbi:hypothetical protein K440DRAFT_636161 [Wilcoxina mikolae CBS 423.85]|nr:hypothetical protein K440DRAFT_636161 [Wilcoxina mikolae CBS 423.85]